MHTCMYMAFPTLSVCHYVLHKLERHFGLWTWLDRRIQGKGSYVYNYFLSLADGCLVWDVHVSISLRWMSPDGIPGVGIVSWEAVLKESLLLSVSYTPV